MSEVPVAAGSGMNSKKRPVPQRHRVNVDSSILSRRSSVSSFSSSPSSSEATSTTKISSVSSIPSSIATSRRSSVSSRTQQISPPSRANATSPIPVIGYIDIDSFECQVWLRDNKYSQYRGQPCIVANSAGRVLASTYEAKDLGISRDLTPHKEEAMKKCSTLVVFQKKDKWGKQDNTECRRATDDFVKCVKKFCNNRTYKDIIVESVSSDEIYIDISAEVTRGLEIRRKKKLTTQPIKISDKIIWEVQSKTVKGPFVFNHPRDNQKKDHHYYEKKNNERLVIGALFMEDLCKHVVEQTGFICSAGISRNKLIAKLACGINKPDKITVCGSNAILRVAERIPVHKISGLGKLGALLEDKFGVTTMSQLRKIRFEDLETEFEFKRCQEISSWALGVDNRPVNDSLLKDRISRSKPSNNIKKMDGKYGLVHVLTNLKGEIMELLKEEAMRHLRTTDKVQFELSYVVSLDQLDPGAEDRINKENIDNNPDTEQLKQGATIILYPKTNENHLKMCVGSKLLESIDPTENSTPEDAHMEDFGKIEDKLGPIILNVIDADFMKLLSPDSKDKEADITAPRQKNVRANEVPCSVNETFDITSKSKLFHLHTTLLNYIKKCEAFDTNNFKITNLALVLKNFHRLGEKLNQSTPNIIDDVDSCCKGSLSGSVNNLSDDETNVLNCREHLPTELKVHVKPNATFVTPNFVHSHMGSFRTTADYKYSAEEKDLQLPKLLPTDILESLEGVNLGTGFERAKRIYNHVGYNDVKHGCLATWLCQQYSKEKSFDYDFVTFNGRIAEILKTPASQNYGKWKMFAMNVNGTIFIWSEKGEDPIRPLDPISYCGTFFEKLVTSSDGIPEKVVVNECDHIYRVHDVTFGKFKLLVASNIDAQNENGELIQVSLFKDEYTEYQKAFKTERELKLWSQTLVSGAGGLLLGRRTKENLKEVNNIKIEDFQDLVISNETTTACYEFQYRMLTFMKKHLPVSDVKVIKKFSWTPGSPVICEMVPEQEIKKLVILRKYKKFFKASGWLDSGDVRSISRAS